VRPNGADHWFRCRRCPKLDEAANQYLARIVSASFRMSELVRDLLAYARDTRKKNVRPRLLLPRILKLCSRISLKLSIESGASVTHDPMPTLAVDRGQMVRLFQNLVGNALKYRKTD
jgi:signal transduction histidine kinase